MLQQCDRKLKSSIFFDNTVLKKKEKVLDDRNANRYISNFASDQHNYYYLLNLFFLYLKKKMWMSVIKAKERYFVTISLAIQIV